MENTTENKKKFFATYWGSETDFFSTELDGEFVKIGLYFFSEISMFHIDRSKVGLKPLSAITAEDAVEVASIMGLNSDVVSRKKMIENFNWLRVYTQPVSDFLRSRSYALPFHDLSVEDLIAYGWVKLTENTL